MPGTDKKLAHTQLRRNEIKEIARERGRASAGKRENDSLTHPIRNVIKKPIIAIFGSAKHAYFRLNLALRFANNFMVLNSRIRTYTRKQARRERASVLIKSKSPHLITQKGAEMLNKM